jgi:hypothetical protein
MKLFAGRTSGRVTAGKKDKSGIKIMVAKTYKLQEEAFLRSQLCGRQLGRTLLDKPDY